MLSREASCPSRNPCYSGRAAVRQVHRVPGGAQHLSFFLWGQGLFLQTGFGPEVSWQERSPESRQPLLPSPALKTLNCAQLPK